MARWMPRPLVRAWRLVHRPAPARYDPFDALTVQVRLAQLSAELQRLDDDHLIFAKAHRVRAAQSAYDALLIEACRLAGVEPRTVVFAEPDERAREELELASRGWFW